jgi:predicted ATP-grasp superfamily ATP-dependent carboligase
MFQKLAGHRDGTIMIAPELDGILFDRIDWLQKNGLNQLMSNTEAVRISADKWLFYQFCLEHELPTPSTYQYRNEFAEDFEFPLPFPFVIKPQLGAGTTMTAVIDCKESWSKFSSRRTTEGDFPPYLLQPFLPGEPVSIACIISPDGKHIEWCPMTKQLFEGLEYRGGIVPCEGEFAQQVLGMAEQVVNNMPGLRGYIGFDFLLSPGSDKPVQILEINSRLTTSYLGYRAIAEESLAKRLVHSEINSPLQWTSKQVQFDTQGKLLFLHGR